MSTLRVEALEQPDGTAFIFNNKNLIINGGMNIWQRATSVTGKTSGGYFTADRWQTSITTAGTWTQTRSTDVPSAQGFGYSLKMDCTVADTSLASASVLTVLQRFEGQNLQHLLKGTSSAKKLTLSFWVKSNKTGTYTVELFDNDNARQISKSYTIDTANTWEKKIIVFEGDQTGTLDNDNGHSLRVLFWLAAGSNFTSGTLNTSWGASTNANRVVGNVNLADSTSNEWYITGCQLEVGSTASGFEFEQYPSILAKCQRYYYQVDQTGIPTFLRNDGSTGRDVIYPFPTSMRANPTVTSTPNFGTFSVPYPSARQLWGRVTYTNDTSSIFLDDPVKFDSEL